MFEYLPLRESPAAGRWSGGYEKKLVLFGLSTCAFCRRAKAFLETEGIPFRWIHLDETEGELKNRAKEDFKARFDELLTFPTLVIDGEDFLIGFIEPSWRGELLS